jgi:O-antigen ligase
MHILATAPRRTSAAFNWHRQTVNAADAVGALILLVPVCLAAYLLTRATPLLAVIYGACGAAALPLVGPFFGSMRLSPANVFFAALFSVLALTTVDASLTSGDWANAKSLAATFVWSSVYIVLFSAVRSREGLLRLTRWFEAICVLITLSVYAAAIFGFGEVLVSRTGTMRAFGPLGDQVGFVLVLPALMGLASGRPLWFVFHVGALLLTATRGATACLIVGVLCYLAIVVSGKAPAIRSRVAAVLGTVAVAAALFFTPVASALVERLWSNNFRALSMEAGLQVLQEHPLTGVGFNGFEQHRAAVAEDWLVPMHAENGLSRVSSQYLQTATDGGVPALAMLVMFALFTIGNAWTVIRWRGATPALVGIQLWVIAMLVGNQSSLWLLSNTASGFFMFAAAGLAANAALSARRDAARPVRSR